MSFILDALRKSEHARQRTTGPGLAEVPVAASKTRTNRWATALVVLLVVNLVAVGVLLLRRAARDTAPAAQTGASPASAAPPAAGQPTPAATAAAPAARIETPVVTGAPPPATTASPMLAPDPPATASRGEAGGSGGRNPLADELGTAGSVGSDPIAPPTAPDAQARAAASAPPAVAATASAAVLPTADEMVARGVPELHLDLHVYSNAPAQRFVFVNSRKYREGDALAEGPVIEMITQDGAVLNFRGSRFRLAND
jgi:general secretion pathway protein B